MNGGIAWLARSPVAANLMMALIVVAGLTATTEIINELFPEVDLDLVSIEVHYLGAAPGDVETGVVLRVEEAIQGIQGIKQIHSTADPGHAWIVAELDLGADAQRVLDEVTTSVQALTTFPADTEEPIIHRLISRNQVVEVAISGADRRLHLEVGRRTGAQRAGRPAEHQSGRRDRRATVRDLD